MTVDVSGTLQLSLCVVSTDTQVPHKLGPHPHTFRHYFILTYLKEELDNTIFKFPLTWKIHSKASENLFLKKPEFSAFLA